MDTRQVAAGLVLAGMLAALGGAAAAAPGDMRQVRIGSEETVTATVSNPLAVPDVLRVEFNGDAVAHGIIDVGLPGDRERVDCIPAENACEVSLRPGEERNIDFTLVGRDGGEDRFMVTVSSDTTGKRSEATIPVRVRPARRTTGMMAFFDWLFR
ncbi:MAG: hypothetical protein SVU88_00575 [Candidatus Nanohaloarchaea archaeon]|nr:hypothetical protein [Candidatus Nanohaloarchaea archaeon]